ncbi:MAG: type II secretion system F family protein [Candidatus Omnitrophica bacterium]|nr:type II secretion system F family protein [Candidatus Omnitrophota bacterium]
MAIYSYKARNNSGELITGKLESSSEAEAINQLHQMQYIPIKISEETSVSAKEAPQPGVKMSQAGRVKVSDLMFFCINLSSMVSAGLPLMGALNVTADQLVNPYFSEVIRKVAQSVSQGVTFSDSLEKFPTIFSKFFVNMVRVGEMSGTMDNSLKTLAVYMEGQENLRQKVIGALIYPAILITAGIGVILLILTFVMPKFVQIFTRSGVPLPLPTRILYDLSVLIQQRWILFLFCLGAFIAAIKIGLQTKSGKDLWQRFLLKTPLFGPVTNNILIARFTRTLGSLLNSGVPLLQSLDILKGIIDNCVFSNIIQEVRVSVEKGEGVHKPLIKHKEFPKDVVYMISVGESAGKMGQMLNKAADFYENKVDYSIKGLVVFIEPVFISFLGVCVGGIMASVLLPMFDMIKTIRH